MRQDQYVLFVNLNSIGGYARKQCLSALNLNAVTKEFYIDRNFFIKQKMKNGYSSQTVHSYIYKYNLEA